MITIIAMISHLLRLRINGDPPVWYRNTSVGLLFVFIKRILTVPFSGFIHYEIIKLRNEPGRTTVWSKTCGPLPFRYHYCQISGCY
jgi:hypothetical protein